MPNWLFKTALQRAISWLPASHWWNALFQKYVTKGLDLSSVCFQSKLDCCRKHFEHYLQFGGIPGKEITVLEIGTGWFPIVPVGLYLCGAAQVWSWDIRGLLRRDTFKQMLRRYAEAAADGTLRETLPWVDENRVTLLTKMEAVADRVAPTEMLAKLNIHAQLGDARMSGLAPASVDLVFSTVTMEHIPPDVLAGLLAEFRRVSLPNAVSSHYIGLADQYASFDHSITPFNFLKYPSSQWRWLDNPMIPLNRLRIADYRRLFSEAGFSIVREENTLGSVEDLRKIHLAPEFQGYSEDDLLVLYSYVVAKAA